MANRPGYAIGCAWFSAERRASVDGVGAQQQQDRKKHLRIFVRENNVEQALRILKKKMQREGIFREMKRRRAYEKPSERRTREKAEAIRRARKAARKQAQHDGLIPAPKRRDLTRDAAGRGRYLNRAAIDQDAFRIKGAEKSSLAETLPLR